MTIRFDFRDKGVFVTDSAAGLGRHIAEAFHALGAKVAIHGASAAEVEAAIRELGGGARLVPVAGDLSNLAKLPKLVGDALAALGRLDVLVCLGTKASLRPVEQIDTAYFEQVMGRNTKQAFFVTQACVPALRSTRGAVVHVASAVGLVGGPHGAVGYATASGAMAQMARMMALELANDGIRVNELCPAWAEASGAVASGRTGDAGAASPGARAAGADDSGNAAAAYAEFFATRSPLHRAQTPQEVAAAVLYLAAPFSGYTTGAVVAADGGISSGHYVG